MKFLSRVLEGLTGVWKFPGQLTAPPGYELQLGIQPVDDLGALAREASVIYGTIGRQEVVAAGSTEEFSEIDPYAFVFRGVGAGTGGGSLASVAIPSGLNESNSRIWLLGVFGSVVANLANLNDVRLGIDNARPTRQPLSNNTEGTQFLARATAAFSPLTSGGVTPLNFATVAPRAFPKMVIPGSNLLFEFGSNAGGGFTAGVSFIVAVAPIGVVPGMARA